MTVSPEQPQDPTLGQLLAQVCRLAGKRRRLRLEKIGLHHAQGMVLFHLWHEDGLSQRDLAAALQITPRDGLQHPATHGAGRLDRAAPGR